MRSRILLIFDVLEHFFTSAVSKWKQENQNWEPSFWPMMDVDQKSNWSIDQLINLNTSAVNDRVEKTPISFVYKILVFDICGTKNRDCLDICAWLLKAKQGM